MGRPCTAPHGQLKNLDHTFNGPLTGRCPFPLQDQRPALFALRAFNVETALVADQVKSKEVPVVQVGVMSVGWAPECGAVGHGRMWSRLNDVMPKSGAPRPFRVVF